MNEDELTLDEIDTVGAPGRASLAKMKRSERLFVLMKEAKKVRKALAAGKISGEEAANQLERLGSVDHDLFFRDEPVGAA